MHLKELRLNKKMSLRQVANLVGYSSAFLCLIENGKRQPKISLLLKLAKVYKVSELIILKAAAAEYEKK